MSLDANLIDNITSCFTCFAVFVKLFDIDKIIKDRKSNGIALGPRIFFSIWAFWNVLLFYWLSYYLTMGAFVGLGILEGLYGYLIWKFRDE